MLLFSQPIRCHKTRIKHWQKFPLECLSYQSQTHLQMPILGLPVLWFSNLKLNLLITLVLNLSLGERKKIIGLHGITSHFFFFWLFIVSNPIFIPCDDSGCVYRTPTQMVKKRKIQCNNGGVQLTKILNKVKFHLFGSLLELRSFQIIRILIVNISFFLKKNSNHLISKSS